MIRTAILIEDNPGDARLLREMFHEEDDPHPIDLTHVESMGEAESSRMVDRVVRAYSDRSTNAQSPPNHRRLSINRTQSPRGASWTEPTAKSFARLFSASIREPPGSIPLSRGGSVLMTPLAHPAREEAEP